MAEEPLKPIDIEGDPMVVALKQQQAEEERLRPKMPPRPKPPLAPFSPEYTVAWVNPDGSIKAVERSFSRQVLVPREGLNVIELTPDVYKRIILGLRGANPKARGMVVNHYFLDGEFHEQELLQLELPKERLVHPCSIKLSWGHDQEAIKFREGDAQEVMLYGGVTLEAPEQGAIVLEVIDPHYVYQRWVFNVE